MTSVTGKVGLGGTLLGRGTFVGVEEKLQRIALII